MVRIRLALLTSVLAVFGGVTSATALPPGVEEVLYLVGVPTPAGPVAVQANFAVDIEYGLLGPTHTTMDSNAAVPTRWYCFADDDTVSRRYTVSCYAPDRPYVDGGFWQCASPWAVVHVTSARSADNVEGGATCDSGDAWAQCRGFAATGCQASTGAQTLAEFECVADYYLALLSVDWRVHCATVDP